MIHSRSTVLRGLLGLGLVCSFLAVAHAQPAERRYPLAERGALRLAVPQGWSEQVARRDALTPPTIGYGPEAGPPFQVLLTPLWQMSLGPALPAPGEIRKHVASAAERVKAQAIEKSIPVLELKGREGSGYYFRATDRAPQPGQYMYLTQGMLALGELRIGFTILTNDGHQTAAAAALEMLRGARWERPRQVPAPTRGADAPPKPDVGRLRALLETGKFAELDAALAAYQDAYRRNAIGYSEAAAAILVFVRAAPELRALHDRWVAQMPGSYVARLARAEYLKRLGYLARGKAYAGKTSNAQFADMYANFSAAAADLAAAVKLDPKPVLVVDPLIDIAQGVGAPQLAANFVDAAIALDPRVFSARASYLALLRPEWGGSVEQMGLAIETWKDALEPWQSERLRRSVTDARWRAALDPAAKLVSAKRFEEAIKLYDEALAQAPVARAFAMRGYSHAQLGRHAKAIEDYDRALELDPEGVCCSGTRSNRARSLLQLKAVDKALPDLLAAAENDDAFAARELAMMYAFGRHGTKRDYSVARRWCERAAKQGDGLAMYCMGGIVHAGLGVPKDAKGAALWFEGAAKRGVADAQADLAFMLWQGQGVAQNRPEAIRWWKSAAKQGNQRAAGQLEANLSWWEYFTEVTLAKWLER